MEKLTTKAIQDIIRNTLFDLIKPIAADHNGEQVSNYSVAMPVTIDGKEFWGEITVKSKYGGKNTKYDPFEIAEEWRIDQEVKAQEKELKAKAKQEKLARSKAKKKTE